MPYLLSHTIDYSADKSPDHEAFRFNNQSISYQELVSKTNNLATLLVNQGIKKGDRIGIYLNKSLESAIAIYGIMRAGAVYVPLNPLAPVNRTAYIIDNCGIKALITQRQKQSQIPAIITQSHALEFIVGLPEKTEFSLPNFSWETVANIGAISPPNIKILEQDLAYIMYTSGSTGEPKGIMHTHHSGLSYAQAAASTYGLNEDDRLGNHSPLHFDMSTLEYFSAPLVGATTVIIPEAYTKMPASLSQLIEKEKLTIWYSVPFALIQLLQRGLLSQRDISSLRWILFGGEPFPPKYFNIT